MQTAQICQRPSIVHPYEVEPVDIGALSHDSNRRPSRRLGCRAISTNTRNATIIRGTLNFQIPASTGDRRRQNTHFTSTYCCSRDYHMTVRTWLLGRGKMQSFRGCQKGPKFSTSLKQSCNSDTSDLSCTGEQSFKQSYMKLITKHSRVAEFSRRYGYVLVRAV